MPRSSRHKSSKHREYSDSEKESSLKERKGKEESSGGGSGARVSKEAGSAEKRKLDSKENRDSGNGEYVEEYSSSSSKRRKEKEKEKERERVFVVIDDGVSDRWNGGGGGAAEDERVEGPKRSKDKEKERSAESKSKRREDESEEVVKKGSGKSEGKNRESTGRKEIERERDREREKERERKGKEGKSEKVVDGDDPRSAKQSSEKIELNALDLLQSPEPENEPDRRMRRKRDGSGDVDKYQDEIGEVRERRFSSREDGAKDGRLKDEKHKDDRYRDKYREDMDRESRHREEKPKDERASRGYTTSRSDDRHSRDEKDIVENRQKKSKPQDSDGDRDHEFDSRRERGRGYDRESYQRDRDREHEHDRDRNRDRERDRVRDRDRDYDRDYDWDWDRDKDRDRDHDRDRDRDHDRERDRDKYRDRDHDLDYDGALTDDRSVRYKDSRGKKRSPDDRDDYSDSKSRGVKAPYSDMDKKSMSSTRVESDAERGRSQSRQTYLDNEESCNRRMNSPNSSSHGGADDYRDSKYRDSLTERRPKVISSRELTGFTGAPERGSKYRSMEKPIKMEDGNVLEPSLERSSSSKASPRSLVDRSPSSTGHERRYLNRTGVRRSMEIEESGRRTGGSMTARDLPAGHERQNWDSPFEKPLVDESVSADSSFYRLSQSNSTLNPFLGALEEDGRVAGGRYKRSGDPNLGRGQGNTWRSTPNWSSPITNGYLPPFHAPPASFQPIIPQFPTPPMFGVRPSMEVNHSGIPYPITDADRFSSHLRPIGWQNVMDGSTPSHLHGWDGSNAVFREETHMYGGSEWDQNRHSITGRGWETNGDMWKGKTDDNKDISLASVKEDLSMQPPVDPVLAGQVVQRSQNESNFQGAEAKPVETKPPVISSPKGLTASPKVTAKGTLDPPKTYGDDGAAHFSQAYLSNLDISVELAGSELYRQCMSLINTEHSKAVGEDTAVLVNLKDGARAVPKSSSTLLHLSLPAPSNAVFQRAMDTYKKLRVGFSGLPIVNGGKVDMICANNNEEQVHGDDAEKSKALIRNGDTPMLDLQTLDINQKGEASPITDVQAPAGESVSNLDRVVNVEGLDQSPNHDGPEKLADSVCGSAKIEVMPSEHMKSEEVAEELLPNSDSASQAGAVLPADGPNDGIDTIEHNNNAFHCAEDGQGLGVAVSGPLYISDGSPNASVALMPGSNESGSVNLSRIHDSPESTH